MAAMLDQIESVFEGFADRPVPQTVAVLQRLADENPDHPGPHVVMALVTSVSRQEFSEAGGHLRRAGEIVGRARRVGDVEIDFFAALHEFVAAELELAASEGKGARGRSTAALAKLEKAGDRAGDSAITQTVVAAARALSQTSDAGQSEHQRGIRDLEQLEERKKTQDLTQFLLVYAHRKAHDYDAAAKVGRRLEGRRPNSALVKRVLGSCAFFANDLEGAEKLYREAVEKAPEDPTTHLGLGNVLARRGKADEARRAADEARSRDTRHKLDHLVKKLEKRIEGRS